MRRIACFAAALLAVAPGLASAAAPACLTSSEFASLVQFALPGAINGATQRCAQSLPGDAFLRREGTALATRYAEGRAAGWPKAKAAFLKLSANDKDDSAVISAMPDPTMQQMLLGLVEGLVASQLPLERCATADRIVRLLAPLPAANTAGLIAALVELGRDKRGPGHTEGSARLGALSICPE